MSIFNRIKGISLFTKTVFSMVSVVLILVLLILVVSSCVSAFGCVYRNTTYLGNSMNVFCFGEQKLYCKGMVYSGNDLISIYPKSEVVSEYGVIDVFESDDNNVVQIKFEDDYLQADMDYDYKIKCSGINGSLYNFGFNSSTVYEDLIGVTEQTYRVKNNMGYVLLGILILVVIVGGLYLWLR